MAAPEVSFGKDRRCPENLMRASVTEPGTGSESAKTLMLAIAMLDASRGITLVLRSEICAGGAIWSFGFLSSRNIEERLPIPSSPRLLRRWSRRSLKGGPRGNTCCPTWPRETHSHLRDPCAVSRRDCRNGAGVVPPIFSTLAPSLSSLLCHFRH